MSTFPSNEAFNRATERMTTDELAALVALQSDLYDAERKGCDGEAETLRDRFTETLNAAILRKIRP